ncbi:MAG: hypothetical protein JSW17_01225 [Candidatus Omnitrophota bacterium]|nr:MAG: hypothetical protein JSW17_01225 [Candidatus Omnitrophota bacterium]
MKKLIFILLLLFAPFCGWSDQQPEVTPDSKKPEAIIFYSPNCKSCMRLKKEFLPPFKEKYGDKLEWKELNTSACKENLETLLYLVEHFKKKPRIPSMFVGGTFLAGTKEIHKGLETAIENALKSKTAQSLVFSRSDLESAFMQMSLPMILGSGLIDGINPCAFAVIVFFVSFLTVYGYRKREIICVGSAYCVAVFITYLFIGLGFFKFLYMLSGFYFLVKAFYYFVAILCFILAGFSFYDYYRYSKTGESKEITLQLPTLFKKNIYEIITGRLRQKERSAISLIGAAFIIGVLVSLLEAVCTGQVYLPTIVFILKHSALRLKALGYLLLYNLMFVVPLIIVFLLFLFGVSSKNFNDFLKRHLGILKIFLAFLFIFLGIFIIWMEDIARFIGVRI